MIIPDRCVEISIINNELPYHVPVCLVSIRCHSVDVYLRPIRTIISLPDFYAIIIISNSYIKLIIENRKRISIYIVNIIKSIINYFFPIIAIC